MEEANTITEVLMIAVVQQWIFALLILVFGLVFARLITNALFRATIEVMELDTATVLQRFGF